MRCVALIIRGAKNEPLRLNLELEGTLHSTCIAPAWLVGVELVGPEGEILNLVQHYEDSDSGPLCGCGVSRRG